MVAALLRAGADARRRRPTGNGALTLAGEFCFTDSRTVDLLCGCGLEAAAAEFHDGSTPLHVAAAAGNPTAFAALLRHGADASARDRAGGTVLHALFSGMAYSSQWTEARASMLGDLVDLGVDIDAACKSGMWPAPSKMAASPASSFSRSAAQTSPSATAAGRRPRTRRLSSAALSSWSCSTPGALASRPAWPSAAALSTRTRSPAPTAAAPTCSTTPNRCSGRSRV
mmetsp:Transcript_32001/g.110625  ORF Transcript_32001/g.110625 Transcript_32001/m.110625 type:complete len:227 (+) Transcript_32001:144-824(+)